MANGGIIGPIVNPIVYANSTVTSFTASGTFTARTGQPSVDVLVIGGGGSGGSQSSGGGGAGGLRLLTSQPIPSSGIPVTVGAGGAGKGGPLYPVSPSEQPGNQGSSSIFGNSNNPITSAGGGAGVHQLTCGPKGLGGSGGGGTTATPSCSTTGNSPPTSPPQGNPGGIGNSYLTPANHAFGAGGGGSGAAAANNSSRTQATPGGAGTDVTPTFGAAPQPFYGPTSGVYAGGGGGSYDTRSPGSVGSGGSGGGTAGVGPGNSCNAVVNTGSGSGGGAYGPGGTGGSGNAGSGIVLVKQPSFQSAPGVWSMADAYNYKKAGQWVS